MQPKPVKSRVVARIFWLAAGIGLGVYALSKASGAHHQTLSFLGAAFILMGCNWFLQPPSLTGQVGQVDTLAKASAIGPAGLRLLLALGSVACLLIALYLWISGGGGITGVA